MRRRKLSSDQYPHLIIDECMPDCQTCRRVWINHLTGHKIVCRCKNKCHQSNGENGLA